MGSNELKPRNPFLFLLLKAKFKWEVKWFYKDVSKISMSKYILLKKTLNITDEPPQIPNLNDDDIMEKASYIRTYLLEKVGDLAFSEDKLDELVQCVRILNTRKNWKDFSMQKEYQRYADWADEVLLYNKRYSELSILEKQEINSKVNLTLEKELNKARMLGKFIDKVEWNSGIIINFTRHLRNAFSDDIDIIERFSKKIIPIPTKDLGSAIQNKLVWLLVDDVHQVRGWILIKYENYNASEIERFQRQIKSNLPMKINRLRVDRKNELISSVTYTHSGKKIQFKFCTANKNDHTLIANHLNELYYSLDKLKLFN